MTDNNDFMDVGYLYSPYVPLVQTPAVLQITGYELLWHKHDQNLVTSIEKLTWYRVTSIAPRATYSKKSKSRKPKNRGYKITIDDFIQDPDSEVIGVYGLRCPSFCYFRDRIWIAKPRYNK